MCDVPNLPSSIQQSKGKEPEGAFIKVPHPQATNPQPLKKSGALHPMPFDQSLEDKLCDRHERLNQEMVAAPLAKVRATTNNK